MNRDTKNLSAAPHAIFRVHAELVNILDQTLTTADTYFCKLCDLRGSKHCKGQMKNIVGHFDSTTHKRFFGNDVLNTEIMNLIKEFRSKKYIESAETTANEEVSMEKPSRTAVQRKIRPKSVNQTELLFSIAKFLVENRLPNSMAPKILKFIQDTSQDYEQKVIEECSISKAIATRIISHCIFATIKEDLLQSLQQSAYSILVDESTDAHGASFLAVCVKYISHKNIKTPVTKLLTIVELGESQTSETLLQILDEEISSKSVKLQQNLVSIVTDQGANMAGRNDGLGARLQAKYPYILPIHDLSHIYNLICKSSIRSFPQEIIHMIKEISSYFNLSSQRRSKLKNIQKELGREKLVCIKEYTSVRWLSLVECLASIDDLWVPLDIYFERFGDEEEASSFTSKNYAYIHALLILIEKLTFYNKIFQSQDIFYDQVLKYMEEGFVVFGRMVLKEGQGFEGIYNVPFETNNLTNLDDFLLNVSEFKELWLLNYPEFNYITADVESADEVNAFYEDIRKFIVKILAEMKKRVPLDRPVLRESSVVFLKRYSKEDWWFILRHFSNILNPEETRACRNEIDRLAITYKDLEAEHRMLRNTPLQMWSELAEVYPQMAKLAKAVLVLPHSSASVERIFSQLKDFKTQKRNRLTTKNLEAALLSYQGFGGEEITISEEMIQKYDGVWASNQNTNSESSRLTSEERKDPTSVPAQIGGREIERQEREVQGRSDLGDIVRSIMITEFQNIKFSMKQRAYDVQIQDSDVLVKATNDRTDTFQNDDMQPNIVIKDDSWPDVMEISYERRDNSIKSRTLENVIPPDRKRVKRNDDNET